MPDITTENIGRQLFLADSVSITVKNGVPVLFSRERNFSHTLQLGEAIALIFLGKYGSEEKASIACGNHIPNGKLWVRHVIEQFWSYLGGTCSRALDFEWMDSVDFEYQKPVSFTRKRTSPLAIVWLVTLACNRKCPYCYYNITPWPINTRNNPPDATFSSTAISRMLTEMQEIGASELYLTGGEPLLRNDLVDIISKASEQRIKTYLSTKYPINHGLASDLKDAGISFITFSLDSNCSKIADGLAGRKGFFQDAKIALDALVKAGIEFEVNTILTRPNEDQLDKLADFLVSRKVPRLSFSIYIPPANRFVTDVLLPRQDDLTLLSAVNNLSAKWAGRIDIRIGDSAQDITGDHDGDKNVCEVGFSEIHVLPDGSATRCRYLPNDPNMQLGTLEDHSLMDIWTGEPLAVFNNPSRDLFITSTCESCVGFQACNTRGRCYVSTLKQQGSYFGPDGFCRLETLQ